MITRALLRSRGWFRPRRALSVALITVAVLAAGVARGVAVKGTKPELSLAISYQVRSASDHFSNSTETPTSGNCSDNTSTSANVSGLGWHDTWRHLRLSPSNGRRRAFRAAPRVTGNWQETDWEVNECNGRAVPGGSRVSSCQARIESNGSPAALTVSRTRHGYDTVIEAFPAAGIQQSGRPDNPCANYTLRYQAFIATLNYSDSMLQRLERSHPHGFTVVNQVTATDPSRASIRGGAARYQCGSTCSDDVSWTGTITLTGARR